MIFLHINNKQNYAFKRLYFSWYPDSSCYACLVYRRENLGFLLDMLPFLPFELFLLFLVIRIIIVLFPKVWWQKEAVDWPWCSVTNHFRETCWMSTMASSTQGTKTTTLANENFYYSCWNKPINIIVPMTPQLSMVLVRCVTLWLITTPVITYLAL